MKEKKIPDSVTIDLSELDPKDREVIYTQLLRAKQFTKDVTLIRESHPETADRLIGTFNSTQASVYAESELIAKKVRSGRIKLLSVGAHSTDAHYLQNKIGGIYTRLEIKSITQSDASSVDKEIANAEAQHRARLNDEQEKPTWHKTTVMISNSQNPWPFSHLSELNESKNNREQLLHQAEIRMDKLFLGSMQSSKEMKREPNPEFKKKLFEAEARIKALEKQPVTPNKRTPSQSSSSSPTPNEADTQKVEENAPPSAQVKNSPQHSTRGPTLRPRKVDFSKKKLAPTSPATQMQITRQAERKKVIEKVSELDQNTRVARKVLVTEEITIVCPHLNMTFVLNRRANKFTAHIKGDSKPDDLAKRERLHWDEESISIRKWRKSYDSSGNNPLHLAILNGDLKSVKFFTRPNLVNTPNKNGECPIHIAAKSDNPKILKALIEMNCSIDIVDAQGNTPLHLACLAGNVENTKTLIESGANLEQKNKKKQTPRSIITNSNNEALKECLASGPRNIV